MRSRPLSRRRLSMAIERGLVELEYRRCGPPTSLRARIVPRGHGGATLLAARRTRAGCERPPLDEAVRAGSE
jgi:hypothetical protein